MCLFYELRDLEMVLCEKYIHLSIQNLSICDFIHPLNFGAHNTVKINMKLHSHLRSPIFYREVVFHLNLSKSFGLKQKYFKKQPGFDPITFTLSKNSNYGQYSHLRCKGKPLLGSVNKLFDKLLKPKSLVTSPSNVLPLHPRQTFSPIG